MLLSTAAAVLHPVNLKPEASIHPMIQAHPLICSQSQCHHEDGHKCHSCLCPSPPTLARASTSTDKGYTSADEQKGGQRSNWKGIRQIRHWRIAVHVWFQSIWFWSLSKQVLLVTAVIGGHAFQRLLTGTYSIFGLCFDRSIRDNHANSHAKFHIYLITYDLIHSLVGRYT